MARVRGGERPKKFGLRRIGTKRGSKLAGLASSRRGRTLRTQILVKVHELDRPRQDDVVHSWRVRIGLVVITLVYTWARNGVL
jgi:hypothetical protein